MENTVHAQSIPWTLNLFGVRIGVVHGLVLGMVFLSVVAAVAPSANTKPKKFVVIVDDQPEVSQSLGFFFRFTMQWDVITHTYISGAMSMPARPKPVLVVLDEENIGDKLGHLYVAEITKKWPGVPVVLWSDHVTDKTVKDSDAAGRMPKGADDSAWESLMKTLKLMK